MWKGISRKRSFFCPPTKWLKIDLDEMKTMMLVNGKFIYFITRHLEKCAGRCETNTCFIASSNLFSEWESVFVAKNHESFFLSTKFTHFKLNNVEEDCSSFLCSKTNTKQFNDFIVCSSFVCANFDNEAQYSLGCGWDLFAPSRYFTQSWDANNVSCSK